MAPQVPPAREERDPGLQPERTRLAWRRTTLSCTVVAVLGARLAIHEGATATGVVAVALCALVWVAFLAAAHRRGLRLAAARPPVLREREAVAAAVCAVLFAMSGVALVLVR